RDVRVDVAVAGHPHRAVERLGRRLRHQPQHLFRTDELGVEPDPVRTAHAATQLEQALGARRDAQRADRLEDAELVVELDAVAAKAHHRRRRVELRDETGGVMGRPARQLALLDENHVAAGLREVVRAADARDPAADDDDHALTSSDVHATMRVRSPRKTSRAVSTTSPAPSYAMRSTSIKGAPGRKPSASASAASASTGSIRSTARTGASSPSSS